MKISCQKHACVCENALIKIFTLIAIFLSADLPQAAAAFKDAISIIPQRNSTKKTRTKRTSQARKILPERAAKQHQALEKEVENDDLFLGNENI